MKTADKLGNPKDIRNRLGLNQQEFWGMIGVTQSGGSRYESGRSMPRPVQHLLRLVHVDQIDISRISRADYELIDYLKSARPALYKQLKAQSNTSSKPSKKRASGKRHVANGRHT